MKKRILLTFGVFCSIHAISQQAPSPAVPTDPTTSLPNPQKGAYAWYRGGNNPVSNPAGTSNLFGTLWNSPIYTVTNGVNRMKLNGSLNYSIDGYNIARSGYLLLGSGVAPSTGLFNNANLGAYSQLHLTGRNGTFVQTGGHRPWMQTGITFTL